MKRKNLILSLFIFAICIQGCGTRNNNNFAGSVKISQTSNVLSDLTPDLPAQTITNPAAVEKSPSSPVIHLSKTPTKTVHFTPTETYTPLPTIDRFGIQGLIDTNGGCELPCWWGIEPGKTTLEQVTVFLNPITKKLESYGPSKITVKGIQYERIVSEFSYTLPGRQDMGGISIIFWNGVVTYLDVDSSTMSYRWKISQILQKMGKPTEIYLLVIPSWSEIPVTLVLYYPDQRVYFQKYIDAYEENGIVKICLPQKGLALATWSSDFDINDRFKDFVLGSGSERELQRLEEATSLTKDDFYEIFSDPSSLNCFESPLDVW
jgi:hypothetical protein